MARVVARAGSVRIAAHTWLHGPVPVADARRGRPMSEKMIINARRELGWRRRILSDVVTVVMWVGWIFLWMPVFRKLHEVILLKMSLEPAAIEVLEAVDPVSIWHSLIALVGTCILLLLWTLLPTRRITRSHAKASLPDYTHYFRLDEAAIVTGYVSRISTVHHDDAGAITSVEPGQTASSPSAA